jgi:hypothetical protein
VDEGKPARSTIVLHQFPGIQLGSTDAAFNVPTVADETYQLQFTSGIRSNGLGMSAINSIGGSRF